MSESDCPKNLTVNWTANYLIKLEVCKVNRKLPPLSHKRHGSPRVALHSYAWWVNFHQIMPTLQELSDPGYKNGVSWRHFRYLDNRRHRLTTSSGTWATPVRLSNLLGICQHTEWQSRPAGSTDTHTIPSLLSLLSPNPLPHHLYPIFLLVVSRFTAFDPALPGIPDNSRALEVYIEMARLDRCHAIRPFWPAATILLCFFFTVHENLLVLIKHRCLKWDLQNQIK